jgi:hypothetical protein
MKKIFILSLLVVFTYDAKADMMKDLELSNELLAMSEYGTKASWSTSELVTLENKISRFSDDNLKQIWISNVVTYSLIGNLPNYPNTKMCNIAKRNIKKIADNDLRSLWNMNYGLYNC